MLKEIDVNGKKALELLSSSNTQDINTTNALVMQLMRAKLELIEDKNESKFYDETYELFLDSYRKARQKPLSEGQMALREQTFWLYCMAIGVNRDVLKAKLQNFKHVPEQIKEANMVLFFNGTFSMSQNQQN